MFFQVPLNDVSGKLGLKSPLSTFFLEKESHENQAHKIGSSDMVVQEKVLHFIDIIAKLFFKLKVISTCTSKPNNLDCFPL